MLPGPDAGEPPDPNEPGADFLTPTSADFVTVEYKGLINSYDTVENDPSNIITGTGKVQGHYAGQSFEVTTSDGMDSFEYVYPADYPDEKLRGAHFVSLQAAHSLGSTASGGSMVGVSIWLPAADALGLAPDAHLLTTATATLYEEAYVIRKDSSTLAKVCYRGFATAGSQAFLDHSANKDFTAGENLILWANAVEDTDPADMTKRLGSKVTQYQGLPCACYLQDDTFDCATWDDQVKLDGTELSCQPPKDFLDPPQGDFATFKYKGGIASGDDNSPKPGFAQESISVGGKSWGSGASGYATDYQGTLVLQVYGDQKSVGQTYSMSMLEIGLPADTLTSAKKAGTNPIVVDATAGVWAVASQLTGVPSGKDYLYRICPFAVYRSGETTGNLYDCPANNVAFTVGENLEIEGSLVLATDITSADVGVELEADGCYCVNGTTNASIACSSLPK